MMKEKLKNILRLLLRSPREFPVEAFMGLAFFAIAAWNTGYAQWDEALHQMVSGVNEDILMLFVPLLVLTFWLHKVNRWAYVVSGFLFLPLMALNLKPFLMTYGFGFTYVLAAILLLVGVKRMDNRSFAAHALHVVTQLFFGLVIAGIITAALYAIFGSFFYIFGIKEPDNFYIYLWEFVWFFIAPQVCCTLITQDEDEVNEPARVLQLILNFILSPAIIIYTVILYAYFIRIVLEWDLPKGGVAWLVMGFVTVAMAGRLMQYVLKQHYYDWFYRNFTWIAIPPLILYWVGSIYRIRLYSFTESRFYLIRLYLSHPPLQLYRKPLLPDDCRCADDAFRADVALEAFTPFPADGPHLRRCHHPVYLYPRHLCQEHRTKLSEITPASDDQQTETD